MTTNKMKEHPILFKTEMVQAILEGRKTQTRRIKKPHGEIGDLLWVKETYQPLPDFQIKYRYKAEHLNPKDVKWKPSIFMPKAAARIWLEITDIKVERLQDISESDAIAEGVLQDIEWHKIPFENPVMIYRDYTNKTFGCETARVSFARLWQSINGEKSWDANPFIWIITFQCPQYR